MCQRYGRVLAWFHLLIFNCCTPLSTIGALFRSRVNCFWTLVPVPFSGTVYSPCLPGSCKGRYIADFRIRVTSQLARVSVQLLLNLFLSLTYSFSVVTK